MIIFWNQDKDGGAVSEKRIFITVYIDYEKMNNLLWEACPRNMYTKLYLKEKSELPKVVVGIKFEVLSWWRRNNAKFPFMFLITADILTVDILYGWAVEVLWYTEQLLKSEIHKNVNIHTTEQLFSNVELQNDLIKGMIYYFELF